MKFKRLVPFGFNKTIRDTKKIMGFNKKITSLQLKNNVVMQRKFNIYLSKIGTHLKNHNSDKRFKNIKFLKKINSYKGRRHFLGLPTRGQRTKTNSKTFKKKKIRK